MRGIFRISLDGAAGFTAANLKPRINAVKFDKFDTKANKTGKSKIL